jgi:hypothetical protein
VGWQNVSLSSGFKLQDLQLVRGYSGADIKDFNANHFPFGVEIKNYPRLYLFRFQDCCLI